MVQAFVQMVVQLAVLCVDRLVMVEMLMVVVMVTVMANAMIVMAIEMETVTANAIAEAWSPVNGWAMAVKEE